MSITLLGLKPSAWRILIDMLVSRLDMTNPLERLKAIVAQLRDPVNGCPWDKVQTHQTLTQYVIEEAYEVVEAIEDSPDKLEEELGDLLLQIYLHSQIASEEGRFSIESIADQLCEKLIRRHPHVFGDGNAAFDSLKIDQQSSDTFGPEIEAETDGGRHVKTVVS